VQADGQGVGRPRTLVKIKNLSCCNFVL
jgi:hypothetical protein